MKSKKILNKIWEWLGWLYFPVYLLFWLLHKIARLLLALAYFGMLQKRMALDIIKYMFKKI